MHDLTGEVIANRFRLTEFLDDGSFGTVYRAEQVGQATGRPSFLAVKILKDDLGDEREILREVTALNGCVHENVIRFHEAGRNHAGRAANRFFIAMELADESLAARLRSGAMTADQVASMARDLCEGLRYLHARKLVHRDLKPANVLCVNERWKLSDFGLAREEGYLRTQSRLGGTPAYSPPEGLSDTLRPSFDMWSIGCILHECLAGRLPMARGAERPTIDADLPAPFAALVKGCLRLDPERRWTAEMCIQHLDPTATPLHEEPELDRGGCFLCEAGNDCARPHFIGTLADIRLTPRGCVCTVFASDELEPTTLLLAESWAGLGARLVAAWPALSMREQGVTLSAFHVYAHEKGYRVDDTSLVVLDPDWLVNVTDLSYVNYCERIQLTRRYKANRASVPVTMGNVVHGLFSRIWNGGIQPGSASEREAELRKQVRELARLSKVDVDAMREGIDTHVGRLQSWAGRQKRTKVLNTESYVIAPRMGLKGRIDALWFQDEEPAILGELKTGRRDEKDVLQLVSYGLMLVSRDEAPRDIISVLLYSKDDPVIQSVKLDQAKFRRAVDLRNRVILLDYAVDAPYNEGHCYHCWADDRQTCSLLATLRGHEDTRSPSMQRRYAAKDEQLGAAEQAFYRRHEAGLLDELRAVKSGAAWLWSRSCEEREREGLAMRFTTALSDGPRDGRHLYRLLAGKSANYSNFKIDERVILSGLEGPVKGRLATAFVTEATADGLVVGCDSPLTVEAGWVSADTDEGLIQREFAALFQWIIRPGPIRDVVVQGRPPTFGSLARDWTPPDGIPLNLQQRTAVEMSVRTRDYLLILGPPGSGKTSLLRAMIEAHLAMGRRVLVSAGTNRAVDQVVRKLLEAGLQSKVVRMGNRNSMAEDVRVCGLDALYQADDPVEKQIRAIRQGCESRPIVAATASFLGKGDYDDLLGVFDLVIIDEATQLSVPATLGPLRLGRRFVLVGDPNQLPPVRISRGSAAPSTDERADSLFELLASHVQKAGAEGLVELENQYRMNDVICKIPSHMWYTRTLRPGTEQVAKARLSLDRSKIEADVANILDPQRAVVFVDVPPDFSRGYRLNLAEARWAARIVAALHSSDERLRDVSRADGRLGILAPFRAQVACIRRALEEHLPNVTTRHWVDTVDRFQGDERDLMIFSLVGGRGWHLPELLEDPRRLNVALSRARQKLILIGNHAFLARTPLFRQLFEVMAEAMPDYIVRPADAQMERVTF